VVLAALPPKLSVPVRVALGKVLEQHASVLQAIAMTFAVHSALGIRVDLVVVVMGLVVLNKVSTVLV
jgi:hypothetical protein